MIMTKYLDKKGLVCAMALLPDKSSEVYELMFSILKNKLGEVKVKLPRWFATLNVLFSTQ